MRPENPIKCWKKVLFIVVLIPLIYIATILVKKNNVILTAY